MLKIRNGITLISLIITIIILLILAGITINIAIGENGLFKKVKNTVGTYENEQIKENAASLQFQEEIEKYISETGNTIKDDNFEDDNTSTIPIYTEEQLRKIGNGETVDVNGKNYNFATGRVYSIQNDIIYNESNENLFSEIQEIIKNNIITIEGNGYIITVVEGVTKKYYTEDDNFQKSIKTENSYSYKGNYQTYIVPITGYYKLECWGAQGGPNVYYGTTTAGGKGGYSYGTAKLDKGTELYIYVGSVGGTGTNHDNTWKYSAGGWNGGGNSGNAQGNDGGGGRRRY